MAAAARQARLRMDSLPPQVTRLDLKQRMEDVAWDPQCSGQLAAVGSQGQPMQLLDLNEVSEMTLSLFLLVCV